MPRTVTKRVLNGRTAAEMLELAERAGLPIGNRDPVRKKRSYYRMVRGRSLGMGANETWCFLFERNEIAPKTKKQTDEDIKQFILTEFPGRYHRLQSGEVTVNSKRIEYMQGKLSSRPRFWSWRYDEYGNRWRNHDGEVRISQATSLLVTPDDTPANEQRRISEAVSSGEELYFMTED